MKKILFMIFCLLMMPIISLAANTFTLTLPNGTVIDDLDGNGLKTKIVNGSTIAIKSYDSSSTSTITWDITESSTDAIPTERNLTIDINGFEVDNLYLTHFFNISSSNVTAEYPVTYEIIDSKGTGRVKKLSTKDAIIKNSTFERINTSGSTNKLINCNMLAVAENTTTSTLYGNVTIESGTYELNNLTVYGNLIINNGTFETIQDTLFTSYSGSTYSPSITINGGRFKGGNTHMFSYRSVTINGGTFDGSNTSGSLIYCSSNSNCNIITINGGKFLNVNELYEGYSNLNINDIYAELKDSILEARGSDQFFTMKGGYISLSGTKRIIDGNPTVSIYKGTISAPNSLSTPNVNYFYFGDNTNLENGYPSKTNPTLYLPSTYMYISSLVGFNDILIKSGQIITKNSMFNNITGDNVYHVSAPTGYKIVSPRLDSGLYRSYIIPKDEPDPADGGADPIIVPNQDPETYESGDWNHDGNTNITDIISYRKYLAGNEEAVTVGGTSKVYSSFASDHKKALDYNDNNIIDLIDLINVRIQVAQ